MSVSSFLRIKNAKCFGQVYYCQVLACQHRVLHTTVVADMGSKTKRVKTFVYDTQNRPSVELGQTVAKRLIAGKTIGRPKLKVIEPPEKITNALTHILRNSNREIYDRLEEYYAAGAKLSNFLKSRHPPLKEREMNSYQREVEKRVRKIYEDEMARSEAEGILFKKLELETKIQRQIKAEMSRRDNFWKEVEYDDPSAIWSYVLVKSASDYAAMNKVMSEIKMRTRVKPRTILDFGSGIGSSIWAALEVFGTMNEVFAVDSSPKMNDFSRLVLQGGNPQARLPAGYFFRLNLPRDHTLKYDLVTSSYTLLDLASETQRLLTVNNLWKKTNQFLILIENGTNAGFQVLSEARHYLTEVCKAAEVDVSLDEVYDVDESQKLNLSGHIFAPCPHELECPRFQLDSIPCNFDLRYRNFYFDPMPRSKKDEVIDEKFCYLVFRKGPKTSDCKWPRLTSAPLKRHNHVVCRMCTPSGQLQEIVAVKRKLEPEKKMIYDYARRLNCGDQFKAFLTTMGDSDVSDDSNKDL